jgi:hypothetical protein
LVHLAVTADRLLGEEPGEHDTAVVLCHLNCLAAPELCAAGLEDSIGTVHRCKVSRKVSLLICRVDLLLRNRLAGLLARVDRRLDISKVPSESVRLELGDRATASLAREQSFTPPDLVAEPSDVKCAIRDCPEHLVVLNASFTGHKCRLIPKARNRRVRVVEVDLCARLVVEEGLACCISVAGRLGIGLP